MRKPRSEVVTGFLEFSNWQNQKLTIHQKRVFGDKIEQRKGKRKEFAQITEDMEISQQISAKLRRY